jgi:hypothetical protein
MAKDEAATIAAGPGGDEVLRKQQHCKLNREINAAMPVCLGASGLGHSRRFWHDRRLSRQRAAL